MGQDPTTCSRTQDRNNNGNQENTERPTIHSRMGRRSGRNPEPPPRIPRDRNSLHEPGGISQRRGKLKIVPTSTALLTVNTSKRPVNLLKTFGAFEARLD